MLIDPLHLDDDVPADQRPPSIRVLVVDDHVLFRRGLSMVLDQEADIEVVGEAATGTDAVGLSRDRRPDVVLMDVRMPRGSGIEACATIKAELPTAKIIMMTSSDEQTDLADAISAGATGYLLKDGAVDEAANAVRLVHGGASLIAPAMAAKLLTQFAVLSNPAEMGEPPDALTTRERQVLQLVAQGLRNRDIATQLFISEHTAKNHVRNILTKLRVESRVEAAMYALRERLVDP